MPSRPRPHPRRGASAGQGAAAAWLAALVTLAGCSGGSGGGDGPGGEPAGDGRAVVHGWVFDPALRPVPGVAVNVIETNANATTDATGYYEFPDAPRGQAIILVATADGFEPASKQIPVPTEGFVALNFSLVPVPVQVATSEVLDFNGRVVCQFTLVTQGEPTTTDCTGGAGSSGGQADAWEFAVAPDLAGAVIEVFWTPGTPLGEEMAARLETLGMGNLNVVLSEDNGPSSLRLVVPADAAGKYYAGGGRMRLTVWSQPNVEEDEANTGASWSVQQDFEAFASLFYVEGPDPSYTVANA